ncbi:MAG: cupin domain-containing protein [Pseudomonadota bacterium]
MLQETNTYTSFMMDRAAGALSPAEAAAADLHIALSEEGAGTSAVWDALGGALLEEQCADFGQPHRLDIIGEDQEAIETPHGFLSGDLTDRKWRRSFWGARISDAGLPNATLLRLDPGTSAPRHGHSRRDVTVVLEGAFADEYGLYERGDIVFGEPGHHHKPRALGDKPCICFVATEPPRPLLSRLFGALRLRA